MSVLLTYSNYVMNPEATNSILNEPISILQILYKWSEWKTAFDMYNDLVGSSVRTMSMFK